MFQSWLPESLTGCLLAKIRELVAAWPVDEQIAMVADRGKERRHRSHCHSNLEGGMSFSREIFNVTGSMIAVRATWPIKADSSATDGMITPIER